MSALSGRFGHGGHFLAPAIGLLGLAACNATPAQEAKPTRPVLVASVHYEFSAPERTLVGTIRPRIETDLGFRVGGKVARRLVEVGQVVKAGDRLALLDE